MSGQRHLPPNDGFSDPEERDLVARLRRALHEEAAMVQPGDDGLRRIEERTGARSRPRWVPWAVAAGVVVVAGVGVLIGMNLGPREPGQTVAAPSTSASTAPSPAGSGTGTSAPSTTTPTTPGAATVAVPVYWLGQQGTDLRLYREFVAVPSAQVPDRTAVVSRAVQLALTGTPADPDYTTPWAPGSAARVTLRPHEIGIDLNQAATDGSRMGSATAAMAIEQLVWTATGAAGANVPVRITVDGGTPDLFGVLSLDKPFTRTSPSYQVLASIWVTSPPNGAQVSSPVTVRGQATVFEAALSWRLQQGDTVIRSGHTMASEGGPGRGTWAVRLGDLPAGSYTFRAYAESPAGDGRLQGEDSKTFTVVQH
jgi:spore germination protein GerM